MSVGGGEIARYVKIKAVRAKKDAIDRSEWFDQAYAQGQIDAFEKVINYIERRR